MKKISIILCTLNEVSFIEKTIKLIKKKIRKAEIIVIDDNSTDGTLEVLKRIKKKFNLKIKVRKNKKGLASAFAEGLKMSSGTYVGFVDVNMSDQILYFNKLISNLENGDDIAVLSRYINGGGDKRVFIRVSTSWLINKVAKLILGVPFNDFTSGIFLMNKKVLKKQKIIPRGHGEFFIEFIYSCIRRGNKISEVPYIQKKDINFRGSKSYPNIFRFFYLGLKYLLAIICIKINNN
jgi:dolichol-phosphate mannosyltransferase